MTIFPQLIANCNQPASNFTPQQKYLLLPATYHLKIFDHKWQKYMFHSSDLTLQTLLSGTFYTLQTTLGP